MKIGAVIIKEIYDLMKTNTTYNEECYTEKFRNLLNSDSHKEKGGFDSRPF